jgi:hypothetical protein
MADAHACSFGDVRHPQLTKAAFDDQLKCSLDDRPFTFGPFGAPGRRR